MLPPPEFHGLHVGPPQVDRAVIGWELPTSRCTRIRVRQATCECKATIFEECEAGGLRFIRRTVRGPEGSSVHESTWLISAEAERLWLLLIAGQAR